MIAHAKVTPKTTNGRFGLPGAILGAVLYLSVLLAVFGGFVTFVRFASLAAKDAAGEPK
jgi:hypothetical protein